MASRGVSPEGGRALKAFLRRYSLLVAYFFAWGLARRTRQRNAVNVREQVVLNYAVPLAFLAWASGKQRIASLSPVQASVLFGLTGLTEETIWRGWTFSEIERIFAGRIPKQHR